MAIPRQQKMDDYEAFVEKFKPKKTTDDCYTPPHVYAEILKWVTKEYHLEGREILRPFYPGGDYERCEYPDGAVVVDNPPFSILMEIVTFYMDQDIPFFLFAPHLTCMGYTQRGASVLVVYAQIRYENGALVSTAFVTNLEVEQVLRTAPELHDVIKNAQKKKAGTKKQAVYEYPKNVITTSRMPYLSDVKIKVKDAAFVRALDEQRPKKAIFGAGLILSDGDAEKLEAAKMLHKERQVTRRVLREGERGKEATPPQHVDAFRKRARDRPGVKSKSIQGGRISPHLLSFAPTKERGRFLLLLLAAPKGGKNEESKGGGYVHDRSKIIGFLQIGRVAKEARGDIKAGQLRMPVVQAARQVHAGDSCASYQAFR